MKKILLSSVALIGIAGTAVAADLPARMPVKAPPIMAPVFSWTGCYIGGYVGGAWGADRDVKTDRGNGLGSYYNIGPNNVFAAHSWDFDVDSSIIGGGTIGCNWQPLGSSFVLGIEGEGGYMSLEGSAYDPYVFDSRFTVRDTLATSKTGDWYAMITGRAGFAFDRVLVYAKGGAAFVNREWSVVDTCFTGGCGFTVVGALSGDQTRATWTVGGGLEWAFDMNWSVKAEYMFIADDRNSERACGVVTSGITGTSFGSYCWDNEQFGIHTAKIGINYRFGGGAPVVARY